MPFSKSFATGPELARVDPVWDQVRREAEAIVASEPSMATFVFSTVLNQQSLELAVAGRVAQRLGSGEMPKDLLMDTFAQLAQSIEGYAEMLRADLVAVYDRDPACHRLIEPILYFKGFHAIQAHRFAHALYVDGRRDLAFLLQSQVSCAYSIDIHPAVRMGKGLFFDHANGLVIGETAVLGDDVSILQGVTLGGTGKESGDRHPKIDSGVLIGAGAKVLGNIRIGHCSRIAAGSVVLKDVPPKTTVAGVPARVVGEAGCAEPSRAMDQILADPGPGN
ncbi:MAG: serine O-acetyltransferase [Rhizobiales bacterium]|nr:serine O-acetyltransferase [Hyphomicrobiales bacterium]